MKSKVVLFALALSFSISSLASASEMIGKWYTDQSQMDFSARFILDIQEKSTTASAVCRNSFGQEQVALTVRTEIRDNTLTFKEAKRKRVGDSSLYCSIDVKRGTWQIDVEGDKARIIAQDGTVAIFKRLVE